MNAAEIDLKLKELSFLSKSTIAKVLDEFEIANVNGTSTSLKDFQGQFELGTDSTH